MSFRDPWPAEHPFTRRVDSPHLAAFGGARPISQSGHGVMWRFLTVASSLNGASSDRFEQAWEGSIPVLLWLEMRTPDVRYPPVIGRQPSGVLGHSRWLGHVVCAMPLSIRTLSTESALESSCRISIGSWQFAQGTVKR